MKRIKTLGVFDSGLGGYSVYHYLKSKLPQLNLVLYADQKNAPYGNQSVDSITQHSNQAMTWFEKQGIHDVLIACNTVCSASLPDIIASHPTLNILGIIDLTASVIKDVDAKVGVVSTYATHLSGAYVQTLHHKHVMDVISKPLPELVSLIESMQPVESYLSHEMAPFKDRDVLILGCTHYPLVAKEIQMFVNAKLVDSREAIYQEVKQYVDSQRNEGVHRVLTTGSKEDMRRQLKALFNTDEKVEEIVWNL